MVDVVFRSVIVYNCHNPANVMFVIRPEKSNDKPDSVGFPQIILNHFKE